MRISDWSSDVCSSDLIQRGYLPSPTYSAHWIADAGFSRAIEDFLARERRAIEREIAALEDYSPFKEETCGEGLGSLEQIRVGWNRRRRSTDPVNLQIGRASCRERVCQYV